MKSAQNGRAVTKDDDFGLVAWILFCVSSRGKQKKIQQLEEVIYVGIAPIALITPEGEVPLCTCN